MPASRQRQPRLAFLVTIVVAVLLVCLIVSRSLGHTPRLDGWVVEPGVDVPSYAVTEPVSTNLNIDTVVLMCEEGASSRIVQLQLYLSDGGPLAPRGVAESALKRYPRAEVVIDQRVFPVRLYFADDYVLVADAERERFPMLSEFLLDAMASGDTMTLRFDLVGERRGQPEAFDSEAVINLQAGKGGRAVNAVRRCAAPTDDRPVGIARAGD
jgi:hypothetical protein